MGYFDTKTGFLKKDLSTGFRTDTILRWESVAMQAWTGNPPSWANMLSVLVLVHNLVVAFEMCFQKQGCKMCFITEPRHGWATCVLMPNFTQYSASFPPLFANQQFIPHAKKSLPPLMAEHWEGRKRVNSILSQSGKCKLEFKMPQITSPTVPHSQLAFLKTFIEFRKFNSKLAFVGINLRE